MEALSRTIDGLQRQGILTVGAGADESSAAHPLEFEVKGVRCGILAFTTDESHVGSVVARGPNAGACGLPGELELLERIRALTQRCDLVVVLLHWGHEFHRYPTPHQTDLCRKMIDAGAGIVVGHHPHVQQGIEARGDGLISYSLGNLLLPEMMATTGRVQYRKPYTKQFALLRAETTANAVIRWELHGGIVDRKYRLRLFRGDQLIEFKKEMEALSSPLASPQYAQFSKQYGIVRRKQLKREKLLDRTRELRRHPLIFLKSLQRRYL